jgi:hypothetical protein
VTATARSRAVWVEIAALALGLGGLLLSLGTVYVLGAWLLAQTDPAHEPLVVFGTYILNNADFIASGGPFAVVAASLFAAAWLLQRLLVEE